MRYAPSRHDACLSVTVMKISDCNENVYQDCCLSRLESGYPRMRLTEGSHIVSACLILLLMSNEVMAQSESGSQSQDGAGQQIVVDDFESYDDGDLPTIWSAQLNGKLVPLTEQFVNDSEWFYVRREDGNGFVRAYSEGEAVHISKKNGDGFDWDLREMPILSWDWRANVLPIGAREDRVKLNDSGGGVYVVFSMEGLIIKRPKAIKYVYSTSLEVGTVISYGKLKVIVVATSREGMGSWQHIQRNVVEDYRKVFGSEPRSRPLLIRLWSDSDNTKSVAEVDFDNIVLSAKR